LVDVSQGPEAQRIVDASLDDLRELGSKLWTGYSFSWLGNMLARAKNGERAEEALEIFAKAFVLRNSFHCNGDQSDQNYSNFKYRPFTLEGNFAFPAGVQEMLLQSHAGVIEVFPAIPDAWTDVAFKDLRAYGAFLVSAKRVGGKVTGVTVTAEQDGPARIRIDGQTHSRMMSAGETWNVLP
jgi:alpha-L-fucosidase 2